MMNFNSDQVVPETLLTSSTEYKLKPCYGKHIKKSEASSYLNGLNNDFFNLYNASFRTEALNASPGSSSSSSGDEAQLVPIRISPRESYRSFDESVTFNFCHYKEKRSRGDGSARSPVFKLDIGERVVIGCESDSSPKRKRRLNRQRQKHKRNSTKERPLACSTMIGSPSERPSTGKRQLSRIDSGIGESTSSLQPESSNGQYQESVNDQTFVVSKKDTTQDLLESVSSNQYTRDVEIRKVTPVDSSVSTGHVLTVEEDEITFALRYFYDRNTGVPRTSTKAKLRLTPKRTERTRIADGHQTTVAHPACTFPFIKLLQKRKKSYKGKTSEKKELGKNDRKNMSDRERNSIVKRMKLFKQSYLYDTNNETIRTLANV